MAEFQKFNSFVEELAHKEHNLGSDNFKIALTDVAPTASNAVLADLTTADLTNLLSDDLSVTSSEQTDGTYALKLNDKTLEASGGSVGPFRYIVIYNDTSTNKKLVSFYDYGDSITLNDGNTLEIKFNQTDGALTLV